MQKGVLFVMTRPTDSASEAEYNDWYDNIHLEEVLQLHGFTAARRYRPVDSPDGVDSSGGISWTYIALYEVEADDLQAVYANLLGVAGRGELRMSPAIRMEEPEPIVQMFELITQYPS